MASQPDRIYFGWLTVATVVNITVLLVSLNWNGFGLNETCLAVFAIAEVALVIRRRSSTRAPAPEVEKV